MSEIDVNVGIFSDMAISRISDKVSDSRKIDLFDVCKITDLDMVFDIMHHKEML